MWMAARQEESSRELKKASFRVNIALVFAFFRSNARRKGEACRARDLRLQDLKDTE